MRKLLKFQGTFHEKSLGQGLGRIAPTYNAHTKSTAMLCFFNCRNMLELRSKPCFKGLLKKPLKNPPNFRTEYTTLFLRKLLRFQRTFHEKSFGRGLGQMPQLITHIQKTRLMPCFLFFINFLRIGRWIIKYCFNRLI